MSCIRFNTPAQREAMRRAAPVMVDVDGAPAPAPQSSPPVTPAKIARLRLLATDPVAKIRESAASSPHSPADLLTRLSRDADAGVRSCVARNERTPRPVLRELSRDGSDTVRAWVAVHRLVPDDVMPQLAADPSETVRALVAWKSRLALEPV